MGPATGESEDDRQHQRRWSNKGPISVKIPPPPTDSSIASYSASSTTSSSNNGNDQYYSPTQPTLSSSMAHRRHSRKKSSQVIIPPMFASASNKADDGSTPSELDGNANKTQRRHSSSSSPTATSGGGIAGVSVNKVASGATFLIGAQLFSKALTFILNQALLKFVGPDLFGASAQLEFLINTILYFSREAVRLSTQRKSLAEAQPDAYRFEGGVVEGTYSGMIQQVVNIGFVAPILGSPLSGVLAYLYYHFLLNNDTPYIGTAVVIFAISAVIELMSEPCFVLSQLRLEFRSRATFESAAIMIRCILTFGFVLLAHKSNAGIIAFALGQLAYSTVLSGLYFYNELSSEDRRLRQYNVFSIQGVWPSEDDPNKIEHRERKTKSYLDQNTKKLAVSIWLQTIFKHCLSEGDKFLVSLLLPIKDQGVYAVVLNYGSLVARLVFLPVEDALRNFFSKTLTKTTNTNTTNNIRLSVTVLSTVLRIYTYVGILALVFGPCCAPFLLNLLVSREWMATDAPMVLSTYVCYIPFLAYNGVLEAFVQSVATPEQIKRQGSAMIIFSLSFAIAGYIFMSDTFFLNWGARGLIYASMLNMTMRIIWCIRWIEDYYRADVNFLTMELWEWVRSAIPSIWILSVAIATALPVYYQGMVTTWKGLVRDTVIAIVLLLAILYSERELISQGIKQIYSPAVAKDADEDNKAKSEGTTNDDDQKKK